MSRKAESLEVFLKDDPSTLGRYAQDVRGF